MLDSPLTPVVLDLHRAEQGPSTLVLGFAGTREEVEWQRAQAAELGITEPGNIAHEIAFWSGAVARRKFCVAPSKLVESIRSLGDVPFVARAGNGVIHYRGGAEPPRSELPLELFRRVKDAYDPKRVFPDLKL